MCALVSSDLLSVYGAKQKVKTKTALYNYLLPLELQISKDN